MYRYFISYQVSYGKGSFGFGHSEIKTDTKITGLEDIRDVAKAIQEENNFPKGSVIILNFKEFDDA